MDACTLILVIDIILVISTQECTSYIIIMYHNKNEIGNKKQDNRTVLKIIIIRINDKEDFI